MYCELRNLLRECERVGTGEIVVPRNLGDKFVAAWHHNDAPWDNTSKSMYILLLITKRPQIRASLCEPFHYKI